MGEIILCQDILGEFDLAIVEGVKLFE